MGRRRETLKTPYHVLRTESGNGRLRDAAAAAFRKGEPGELSKCKPKFAQLGQDSHEIGRDRTESNEMCRVRTQSGRVWSERGAMLTPEVDDARGTASENIERAWPGIDQNWPESDQLGQFRPDVRPTCDRFGRKSDKFHIWPVVDQTWADLHRTGADVYQP